MKVEALNNYYYFEQAYLVEESNPHMVVAVCILAPEGIPAAVEGMHLGAGQDSPPVGDTPPVEDTQPGDVHPGGGMHSEAGQDNRPEGEQDNPLAPEAEQDNPPAPEAEWDRELQLHLLSPGLK